MVKKINTIFGFNYWFLIIRNMKRLLIIVSMLCLISGIAMAQGGTAKYRGDVEFNLGNSQFLTFLEEVTTSHGIVFNDHFFAGVGVGIGLVTTFDEFFDAYYLPIFIDANYTFDQYSRIRPYVGGRFGAALLDFDSLITGNISSIYAGIQFQNRMTLQIRPSWQPFNLADQYNQISGAFSFDIGFGYRF